MQDIRVEDWLRVQRELLAAERQFSLALKQYADGITSAEELAAAKELVEARRALADEVTARVGSAQLGAPGSSLGDAARA